MKKNIGNFMLDGWVPTPVEQTLMNGSFSSLIEKSVDADSEYEDIPSDFLELQDFDIAMKEIKSEIDKWQES